MAPLLNPYTSGQYRSPLTPAFAGSPTLNPPICDPRFTRRPNVDKHYASQWVLAGTEASAPAIAMETVPRLPRVLGPAPEDTMTRLQAEQRPEPPVVQDMQLPYLNESFPRFFANQVGTSLPNHDVTYLPNDLDTFVFGLETIPSQSPPVFGGVECMQGHMDMAHMNATYQQTEGNTLTNTLFCGTDAYATQDYSWSPSFGPGLRGSISPSAYTPRTLAAGMHNDGMTITVKGHEASSTTPTSYLLSPTLSAHTRLTPARSPSSTPLSPQSPIAETANTEQYIRVIVLFDRWRAGQPDSFEFTPASLPSFKAYCVSELISLGHSNVSRLFGKEPKAVVGTQVSREDRFRKRKQTIDIFDCPLLGCDSQCTRKHNLNLHLGAHIGLTDRCCGRCDAYFSASSINRHMVTCSGKNTQCPRPRYGVIAPERN